MFGHIDDDKLRALLRDDRVAEGYKARVRAELESRGEGVAAPPATVRAFAPDAPGVSATSRAFDAAPVLRLVLYGPPRTKKTSNQVVFRGGKPKVLPSAAWLAWLDALRETGQLPDREPLPDRPYHCRATFYRDADRGDLVGFQQGLADVLEEGGVLSNDKWIRSWDSTRLEVDRACPRVVVVLTPM